MPQPIDQVIVEMRAETKQFRRELRNGVQEARASGKRMETSMSGLRQTLGSLSGAARLFGVTLSAALIGVGLRKVSSTVVLFENLRASLVTVTGSMQVAEAEWKRLLQFTSETPFQIDQVTQAFIQLKALGLDASIRTLRSYGNIAASMGRNITDIARAIGSATVGETEALKSFGIKMRIEGDKVRLIFRGMSEQVENTAANIENFMIRIGEREFAGGMRRQMETLGGAFSNFTDELNKAIVKLSGESGLTKALKDATGAATELLRSINAPEVEKLEKRLAVLINEQNQLEQKRVAMHGRLSAQDAQRLEALNSQITAQRKLLYELNSQANAEHATVKAIEDKEAADKKAAAAAEARRNKVTQLYDALHIGPKVEKELTDRVTLLTRQYDRGQISLEQYTVGVSKLTDETLKLHPVVNQVLMDMGQFNDIEKDARDLSMAIQDVAEALDLSPEGKLFERIERLQKFRSRAGLGDEQLRMIDDAIAKTTEQIEQLHEEGRSVFDDLKDAVEGWGRDSAREIIRMARTGKVEFRDLVNSIVDSLAEIAVYRSIFAPLTAGFNNFLDSFLPKRQGGGRMFPGQMYLAGERPEVVVPDVPSTVRPISGAAMMGPSHTTTIVQHIHVSTGVAPTVQAEMIRLLPTIRRQSEAGILNAIRSGGPMARAVGAKQ